MRERVKLAALTGVIGGCVVLAFTAPVPTPVELRAIAVAAGPLAPILFFCGYALFTALPVPRTVFSLAAGLLLGNALGITIAMAATITSAAAGYGLARLFGAELMRKHRHRDWVRTVDGRLTDGGVAGVASLRLIPIVPFAPFSYCCGLSAIRLRPYLLGTAVGSLPGTTAVVILGDALTGATPPALIACYAAFAAVGTAGVYFFVRKPTPEVVLTSQGGG